jgi:hypothetical protein
VFTLLHAEKFSTRRPTRVYVPPSPLNEHRIGVYRFGAVLLWRSLLWGSVVSNAGVASRANGRRFTNETQSVRSCNGAWVMDARTQRYAAPRGLARLMQRITYKVTV